MIVACMHATDAGTPPETDGADRSTPLFIETCFREMKDKKGCQIGAGRALSAARATLLAGGTFSHPYYWAPFILLGEWQ